MPLSSDIVKSVKISSLLIFLLIFFGMSWRIGCYTISLHIDPDETLLCLWRPSFQSFATDTTQENFQFYEHFPETSKAINAF